MSRVDDIISSIGNNGTEKKKSRVESIIENSSNGNLKTGVDKNYINSFAKDTNDFLSNFNNDLKDIGFNNASSYYDTFVSKSGELAKRAKTIQAYLNSNKNNLDEETYNSLMDSLNSFYRTRDSIVYQLGSTSQYYSQWDTEDEYKEYQKQQEEYEALLKFDTKTGAEELRLLESDLEGIKATENQIAKIKQEQQILELAKAKGSRDAIAKFKENEKLIATYNKNLEDAYAKYGGKDGLESLISQKNQYLTSASRAQKAVELASVAENEDFEKNSKYIGLDMEDISTEEDLLYMYINGNENVNSTKNDPKFESYRYINDDQKKIYNYYYNTGNKKMAQEYLDAIQEKLNYQQAEAEFKSYEGKLLSELVFGISAGLDQFESGMEAWFSGEDYIPTSPTQYLSGMIREDLGDDGVKLPDWLGGSSLGQVGYDAITTTSNMLPSILTSAVVEAALPTAGEGGIVLSATMAKTIGKGVGAATLGASAGGNGRAEMLRLGYSKEQANAYGVMVGAAEAGMEYLLGNIPGLSKGDGIFSTLGAKAVSKVDNALARVAITIGGSLDEALEEGLQTIIEPWLKEIATGVDWDDPSIDEVLYSSLLGAITSAGFQVGTGAINLGANAIHKNQQTKAHGQAIIDKGGVDTLKELALEMSGASKKTTNLANKVGQNASAKNVGRLSAHLEESISKQNRTDIENALVEKGLSKKDAKMAAEYVADSGKLTAEQEARIESSDYFQKAIDAVLEDSNTNVSTNSLKLAEARIGNKSTTASDDSAQPHKTEKASVNASEKEIVTESKFEASANGKTRIGETEVSIKEIASVKNGEMILRLEDGSTVNASEVEYGSNAEGLLYENVVHMGFNAATANAFVNGYDGNLPVAEYALDFRQAYRYGELGIPKSEMSSEGFSSSLTEAQKSLAYDLGMTDAKYKTESKKASATRSKTEQVRKGKLHNTLTPTNETQRASLKTLGVIAEALGIDIYTFESPLINGKRQGANGWYDAKTNSIHIDLFAGAEGKGTMLFTAAHELTHHIREKLPAKFKVFADFLFEQYGEKGISVSELIENKRAFLEQKGRITPNMTEAEAYDLAYEEVVADACESFLADGNAVAKIAELKAKDKTLWQTIKDFLTKLVERIKAAYEGLSPDSVEGRKVAEMLDTAEQLKALWTEMLVEASEVSDLVEIDSDTESVSPMFSERTWTASEYVTEREETAKKISKALGVDITTAYKYIDDINGVARLIADDRARLDYEPNLDEKATVLKPNSEYKFSVDMSTLCAKRLLFTGTFDAIQKALPNMVFDSEDIVSLREMMQKRGYEVACGICYVESTRREIGRITQEFIDRYKVAQQTGRLISRINSSGKEVILKSAGRTFSADKNYTPNLGELNTTDIDIVKRDHREVYDAYLAFMNARGQAKPKLLETRAEYKGEILKHFKAKSSVEARNNAGGLRLQSFSDFEVPHMIDMMQIVMDMSRVGLKSQAYTKVPAFAEIFGDAGVKINLSLIAKGDGLDANGNLIFDDVEGINHKEAFKLRDKYSKNVGTILVGKTDAHIIAAMADPRIDYIIPFHKSSWKESLYDALGLTGYADYTDYQNEKPIDKDRKIKNFDPSEYWDFTKSGDENAQIYLEKCREDGRIPKFPQFQGYPGYWKLLIDFKMYDNDGIGSPQEVVIPIFNTEASEKILGEYKGGHKSFPVAKDVVEDFVKEHRGKTKNSDINPYSYEVLTSKKEMEVKTLPKLSEAEITKYKNDTSLFGKDMRQIAASVNNQKNTPTKTYLYCRDLGADVLITKDSFKHSAARMDATYIAVCKNIAEVLNNSIAVNELKPRDSTDGGYVLLGMVETEDNYVIVRSVVNKRTWKLEEYEELDAIKKKSIKKEDVGFKPPHYIQKNGFGTSSAISIADFLKFVNTQNIANSVLSLDVIDKLGSSRGFDEKVTPNLKYSDRASYAPTFYSYMGKVIDDIKLEKMGTSSILNHLKNRGVKNDEIKWSGIEAFLEGKKSVTKAELQEFLAGSQLQIEEQISGDDIDLRYDGSNRAYTLHDSNGEVIDTFTYNEFMDVYVAESDEEIYSNGIELKEALRDVYGKNSSPKWAEYKLDGGSNYRELVFVIPNSSYSNRAMRAHWGQDVEGVLAHARVQDVTTADGKRMLFIEELQSDWHNEGHEKGYTTKEYEDAVAVYDKLAEDYANKRRAFNKYVRSGEFRSDPDDVSKKKFDWLRRKMDEAEKRMQDAERDIDALKEKGMGDVPDAPFRDTYHEYVLKRLLRMAAEEGYESIGWTTADIQSERWSDEFAEGYRIEYDQDIPKFLRKYGKKWGATVGKSTLKGVEAKEIYYDVNRREQYGSREAWEDEVKTNLVFQGMPARDVRYVKFKEEGDYLIAYGKDGTEYDRAEIQRSGDSVWSMDITDSMTESVLYEGQVLYSDRNYSEGLSEADKEVADRVIANLKEQKVFGKYYRGHGTYTEKRINDEIAWSMAQNDPDYAQTYITWVKPSDYIYATTATEAWREQLAEEAGDLDKERLTKEQQPIYLTVDFETGKITGHEGRHRMIALEKAGVEKVAVIIISRKDQYWQTKPIEAMKLEGQDFGDYKKGVGFFLHNMLPLSERYADVAREMFSFDSTDGVRFSDRSSDSVSNRTLLANALESVVQNDIERNKLTQYKEKISLIESEQAQLADIRAEIKELSFAKGGKDTARIKELQFKANQTANRINTYDRQLLNLESTKALKDVLEREKQMAFKRAEQRGREALKMQREKDRERNAKTQRELMNRYQESRKKGIEGRHKTEMRHKIKDVVNELNQYLTKGTKDKHVPIELQKAVAEALNAVNMDTVSAEERIAKKRAEMMKAKSPEVVERLAKEIEHIQEMGGNMAKKISRLKTAYDSIINSDDPLIANSHDEVISNSIGRVMEVVGDTPLRDMSLYQLEAVYDMYKMVLTTIRNANKAFKTQKSEEISVIANRVMEEIDKLGKKKLLETKASQLASRFDWNNLKPVYAFERIGSDTFTEVFNNVRAGEDTWAVDITEAKEFSEAQHSKFNYASWDFSKRFGFTSTSGMHFELSLDQIMSLYAYSKREQAKEHLKRGGIVFDETTEVTVKTKLGIPVKFNPTQATAYNISDETLVNIIGKLTAEQREFVDVMQDYLSTTMGEKGNEVSLALYGVKLYKEKNYFPLKSAIQFMAKAKEQLKGEVKIKNSGFSKETTPNASNPIVLTPFMDVWASHVNEMSMYHAFVLPLEDFYRVFNYKTPTSDTMATESVEMFLQNAYGKAATQYIDQLLKDLNGGARVDSTVGVINKLTSLFKKSAVFASASVVIQQPSAIARATALVDSKYFVGKPTKGKHKDTWAEVKKYAPVAIIKEMGYFDTGMGQSTVEWLKGEKTLGDKIDDIASKAPALADEFAWCAIWNAVKRETLHTQPKLRPNSEEFLKAVGERFTEVITKTQVYDSVLARSGNMRSKDTGMKMATAFMAEPTTSLNMLENALIQGKRGNIRYARKAIGSVVASMILNSILVSIVYAGRDDDEDKTYAEKYIGTFTEELLDSLNPLTLVPFVKDIVSIVQGYDVERSDMAVITDLVNAWNNLDSDNRSVYRKVEDFGGAIASLFGLPVKNIMRDVRGMYNTINSFINGEKTTGAGIKDAVTEAVTGESKTNGQQLYEAIVSGDSAQIERVMGRFENQDDANSAFRKVLKEKYQSGEVSRSEAIDLLITYGGYDEDFDEHDAHWKIEEWDFGIENEDDEDAEYSKYADFYEAVETGKNIKAVIREYTDHGVEADTLAAQITKHYKPLYKEMSNSERTRIKGYLLNAYELLGYDRSKKSKDIDKWLED